MKAYLEFIEKSSLLIERLKSQGKKIEQVADEIGERLGNGGFLYASGTGHSHMLAEEMFYRAGGLVRIKPIFQEDLMLHKAAYQSSIEERKSKWGVQLIQESGLMAKDAFFIASQSGRNTVSVDMALEARRIGAFVVVISSLEHSSQVASRHPEGYKLPEVADVFLDSGTVMGDACLRLPGLETACGAQSTIAGATLVQALMVQICQTMLEKGLRPELFSSANTDEGEAQNETFIQKYQAEIPSL